MTASCICRFIAFILRCNGINSKIIRTFLGAIHDVVPSFWFGIFYKFWDYEYNGLAFLGHGASNELHSYQKEYSRRAVRGHFAVLFRITTAGVDRRNGAAAIFAHQAVLNSRPLRSFSHRNPTWLRNVFATK